MPEFIGVAPDADRQPLAFDIRNLFIADEGNAHNPARRGVQPERVPTRHRCVERYALRDARCIARHGAREIRGGRVGLDFTRPELAEFIDLQREQEPIE